MKTPILMLLAALIFGCDEISFATQFNPHSRDVSSALGNPVGTTKVNRTVPKVDPPKTRLEFSANPTTQEISRARVFEEPLVPVGGEPTPAENADLAAALLGYAKRSGPDDFTSLTGFLRQHPKSPWRAALLTVIGLDYYNTAYYSQALAAWQEAWMLGQQATDAQSRFLADRAGCELAALYSRLGRMTELEALLKSVEQRVFLGGAAERINLAREALSMMQQQPEVSFRCGPLALQSIQRSLDTRAADEMAIFNSASTQQGFSLPQVAELSKTIGLNYQMAFRKQRGEFILPSVVHWKAGHYAALIRKEGDRYLLEDPTFGNTVWATQRALETETSGYFLVPAGKLPNGWRSVDEREGGDVRGKGVTTGIDPDNYTEGDLQAGSCLLDGNEAGMAISGVHLGLANLQVRDTPVGYMPPVGPAVRFTVRYNHRDYLQQPSAINRIHGPSWTHDWYGLIKDNPGSPSSDVKYHVGGGGARTFTGFNAATQTFATQQFDQTLLKRTGTNNYEMTFRDGSKKVFGLRQANSVLLTQVIDPAGNAVTLTWSGSDLVGITDAIGQVTTLAYDHPSQPGLITKVTDPFGRFANFEYDEFQLVLNPNNPTNLTTVYSIKKITDVLGLASQFVYAYVAGTNGNTNITMVSMSTPYGTTSFNKGQGGGPSGTTRFVETTYPDGSRDRVEYNQNTNGIAFSDPLAIVPQGMNVFNQFLHGRNTFYWSRNACAQGYGDYSKAKIYHWLHTPNLAITAGILESVKEPLERRVWFNYADQTSPFLIVGSSDQPTKIGRVLDDGSTQLYTYAHNTRGNVINAIDPIGRELSYIYATNGIDLLEVRQTRGANNELLARATFNNQHRPLTTTDAAGQTTTNTYNARGQLLTTTNPKGETTTYTYNGDGYLISMNGPLPGTNDVVTSTFDFFGRTRTVTDESGYTLTYDYDDMDRLTRVTFPDGTFNQYTYDRLDLVGVLDSASRQTVLEYDNMRQVTKQTDSLGRVTRYEWCSCGGLGSLTDAMGRKTEWHSDVQGRLVSKQFGDGSKINYFYESTTSRLRQVIDEKQQVGNYSYNRDDTLKSIGYANATIPTPGVSYAYDPNYKRVVSMSDGTGTTIYSYNPITTTPTLGAGVMASVNGPLPNDTITYGYDELGRRVSTAINGTAALMTFDAAGRVIGETNALGIFTFGYDGTSSRLVTQSFPNGHTGELAYGNNLQDRTLQRITHKVGATAVSEFLYGHNVQAGRITTWSQQVGVTPPSLHTFGYDTVNQLLSATVTNAGALVNTFAYAYDPAGNRLTEQVGVTNSTTTYNALNQISTSIAPGVSRTNEWDAEDRLVAVNIGNQRTEFTYDGISRLVSLRLLTNGSQVALRQFVWCGGEICEERDAAGVVTKRFFGQGVKIESGTNAGNYFYTRDHLGSIRELTDDSGAVRARYAYDPYGRRTKLAGDMEADFGFAGMFWSPEVNLSLTHYRAYDPELGRWLSRDPLKDAELIAGPNLYAYVGNDPINYIDPEGLLPNSCQTSPICITIMGTGVAVANSGGQALQRGGQVIQRAGSRVVQACKDGFEKIRQGADRVKDLFVTRGGNRIWASGGKNARTVRTPETVQFASDRAERVRQANEWWLKTLEETHYARMVLLETAAERQDAIRQITETMNRMFGL